MSRVKENIALEFDEFSGDYTRDMTNCVPHYLRLMDAIVESIPNSFKVSKVLDLGSGNGNLSARLMQRFQEAEYTLVDASPEMLKICRNRFPEARLQLFEGYFDQFSYQDAPYDLAVASFSFHHIGSREKEEIFSKIYETLRPGGILAMCDLMISKDHPDHPLLLNEWDLFVNSNNEDPEKWVWIMEHYDAFDRPDHFDDQIRWLQQAGFTDVSIPWKKGYWMTLKAVK